MQVFTVIAPATVRSGLDVKKAKQTRRLSPGMTVTVLEQGMHGGHLRGRINATEWVSIKSVTKTLLVPVDDAASMAVLNRAQPQATHSQAGVVTATAVMANPVAADSAGYTPPVFENDVGGAVSLHEAPVAQPSPTAAPLPMATSSFSSSQAAAVTAQPLVGAAGQLPVAVATTMPATATTMATATATMAAGHGLGSPPAGLGPAPERNGVTS